MSSPAGTSSLNVGLKDAANDVIFPFSTFLTFLLFTFDVHPPCPLHPVRRPFLPQLLRLLSPVSYWEIGCWAWDVCAGIIILEEAGGLAFGAKQRSLKAIDTGKADVVDAEVLQGRKYLFVRPMLGEGGKEAQLKLAKEFFEVVEEYDP